MNEAAGRIIHHSPNIGLRREDAVEEGLGRHPLHGQHGFSALSVVVGPVDVPRHAEVGDFGYPSGAPVDKNRSLIGYLAV